MTIGHKDVYETYCKLIIQSETISWQRFHVFLVVNSILFLSWITLFKESKSLGLSATLILCGIPIVGIAAGFAWADLGYRGREYLNKYKALAEKIESDKDKSKWWDNDIGPSERPFQIKVDTKIFSSSHFLLTIGPCVFLLLHVGLLAATLLR